MGEIDILCGLCDELDRFEKMTPEEAANNPDFITWHPAVESALIRHYGINSFVVRRFKQINFFEELKSNAK